MCKILNIGFVGCGEVTQVLHLPTLRELPELFDVVAFCDVSKKALDGVAAGWPGARRHVDLDSLVNDPNVHAVVIANPNAFHAEAALSAMRAGKHVMIEKPVCVTLDEAKQLLAAERQFGVVAQVGYMRRHAPGFVEAVQLLADRKEPIHMARVHDVIGPNSAFVDSGPRVVVRADDVSRDILDEGLRRQHAQYIEAIGVDSGPLANAFGLCLGLVSHDTSAMRELLGMPKGVLYAKQRFEGRWITAAFDYGDFICHLEVGLDEIARFDCCLEAFMPNHVVKVTYESPYIRHQATTLARTGSKGPVGVTTSSSFATRNDAFVAQWRAFHEHVVEGTKPKCSIEDASQDLVLFQEMIRLMH